ncbi:hypothetical protein D1007_27080 [Hordeum vulgare]|nr:hypothetical protein D1007_27080 [Hordeum vulgare]
MNPRTPFVCNHTIVSSPATVRSRPRPHRSPPPYCDRHGAVVWRCQHAVSRSFIVCSSCFTLIQVPAVFAVVSAKVRDLRCGACSVVLSYSYHDPDRKKPVDD